MVFDGGGISCVCVSVSSRLSFNSPSSLTSPPGLKWHAEVWWILWINSRLGAWRSMPLSPCRAHTHTHSWCCGHFSQVIFSLSNILTNNTSSDSDSHIIPSSWPRTHLAVHYVWMCPYDFVRAFYSICVNLSVCVSECFWESNEILVIIDKSSRLAVDAEKLTAQKCFTSPSSYLLFSQTVNICSFMDVMELQEYW